MISFRYHIASLVAVLLALAAGVALGSGPLEGDSDPGTANTGDNAKTEGVATSTADKLNAEFAASLQFNLTLKRLTGRTVTMLVLPGAAAAEVNALSGVVDQAGGTVTGTLQVGPDLVDAAKKQLVDELGGQLEAAATKVTVPSGASTYQRLGTLLAYAVGSTSASGSALDQQAQSILAGLSTASLVTSDDELRRRGNLVLVVAGPPSRDASAAEGTGSIVASLVKAIDARTGGVVVAGPGSAAGPAGVLTALRDDTTAAKTVSTVDSIDGPAGVIVTVLALQEQVSKKAGQYGAGPGVEGPRPGVPAAGE